MVEDICTLAHRNFVHDIIIKQQQNIIVNLATENNLSKQNLNEDWYCGHPTQGGMCSDSFYWQRVTQVDDILWKYNLRCFSGDCSKLSSSSSWGHTWKGECLSSQYNSQSVFCLRLHLVPSTIINTTIRFTWYPSSAGGGWRTVSGTVVGSPPKVNLKSRFNALQSLP